MVSSVRNSFSSQATRYGWIGRLSDLNSGISFSVAASSALDNSFIQLRRACRLSFLMRPLAAASTAPSTAPGSPTIPSVRSRFLPTVR